MFNLCSRLSFTVFDLALGLVERAAFIQLGIGTAARRDLPDHFTIFMLFAFLDTGVSSVCVALLEHADGDMSLIEPTCSRAVDGRLPHDIVAT